MSTQPLSAAAARYYMLCCLELVREHLRQSWIVPADSSWQEDRWCLYGCSDHCSLRPQLLNRRTNHASSVDLIFTKYRPLPTQMHLQGDDDVESRHLLLFEEGDRKLKALADDDQQQRALSKWDVWIFLLSAMCGSGILVQPFVFMQSGILLTVIIYVIVASIVWLSVHILLQTAEKVEIYSYTDLCRLVLGQPGRYIAEVTFIFCYFCALLSYLVAIGTLSANIMITVVDPVNESGNVNWLSRPTFNTIMIVLIFITPMTLIRQINLSASIVARISIVLILSMVVYVIAYGQLERTFYFSNHSKDDLSELNLCSWAGVIRSIGVIVFTFSYTGNVFPTYNAISPRDSGIIRDSSIYTTISGIILCIAMGIGGYLTFCGETNDNVLNSFKTDQFFSGSTLIKVLAVIHLIIYIPREFFIMRNAVYGLLAWNDGVTDMAHMIVSLCILFQGVSITIFLLEKTTNPFYKVISLSGGVCGSILILIMPGLMGACTYKGEYHGVRADKTADLISFIIGNILVVIGLVLFTLSCYANVNGLD